MKVGDLVQHVDIPKKCRIVGVVVEIRGPGICEVIWFDRDNERFIHHPGSLELISESR